MKTQSRAFRTSDWAEGLPSNRTVTLSTQQEWTYRQLCECPWVAQPQPGLECNQTFLEKLEMPPSNLTELETAKKWGEEWQILAKFWYAKFVISYPERLEAVKALQLSTELREGRLMQCTNFSFFFFFHFYKVVTILFLLCSLWCMECRLMWKKK